MKFSDACVIILDFQQAVALLQCGCRRLVTFGIFYQYLVETLYCLVELALNVIGFADPILRIIRELSVWVVLQVLFESLPRQVVVRFVDFGEGRIIQLFRRGRSSAWRSTSARWRSVEHFDLGLRFSQLL